ncbi:MAG TPA: rubrerythrin family protein, partial [Candidatus Sulfotelmatobacter sp.]|nr:rubrerythrin family protein [Candidatus Sulfotelmatobacter sp.]
IRYRKLLANVEADQVFKRPATVKWHCRNCGYVHEGPEAPDVCPACKHPQAYYEVLCENY